MLKLPGVVHGPMRPSASNLETRPCASCAEMMELVWIAPERQALRHFSGFTRSLSPPGSPGAIGPIAALGDSPMAQAVAGQRHIKAATVA